MFWLTKARGDFVKHSQCHDTSHFSKLVGKFSRCATDGKHFLVLEAFKRLWWTTLKLAQIRKHAHCITKSCSTTYTRNIFPSFFYCVPRYFKILVFSKYTPYLLCFGPYQDESMHATLAGDNAWWACVVPKGEREYIRHVVVWNAPYYHFGHDFTMYNSYLPRLLVFRKGGQSLLLSLREVVRGLLAHPYHLRYFS